MSPHEFVLLAEEISLGFCLLSQMWNELPKLADHSQESVNVAHILGCVHVSDRLCFL